MLIEQRHWSKSGGWKVIRGSDAMRAPQLVVFFGASEAIAHPTAITDLRATYSSAEIVGCSTAGEICDTQVHDGSIVATAIQFADTRIRVVSVSVAGAQDSETAGTRIAKDLLAPDLRHVFVLSKGVQVNGSELVNGLSAVLPATVSVTGGLAGDAARFANTTTYCNGDSSHDAIAAIGFYGDRLQVGFGAMGGWDSFGPDRLVTRSEGNIVFELDGRSALELYERYLGPHADALPASGLHFPLSLRGEPGAPRVVRTIVGMERRSGSLTFAGDVPQGSFVRLMKSNIDRVVDGAHGAALESRRTFDNGATNALALLVSCVARKLILQQRVEEEVEIVRSVLGEKVAISGFYSYGEIGPFAVTQKCELHNQTMSITTLGER